MATSATSYMIDDYLAMFQFSGEWSPRDCLRDPLMVRYPIAAPFYGRLYAGERIVFLRRPESNDVAWRAGLTWAWQQLGQYHALGLATEPAHTPFFSPNQENPSGGSQLYDMGSEVFIVRMTRPFTPVILVNIEGAFAAKQSVIVWRRRRSPQGMSGRDESPDAFRDRLQRIHESLSRQPFESNFHSICR